METTAPKRLLFEQPKNWLHGSGDPTDLIGKRGKTERKALALETITLAVERLVQPELVEGERCQEMRAEHGARRDMKRRRRLSDGLARPAGEAFADCLDDLVPGGHALECAVDVLAKLAEVIGTAAWAALGGRDDDPFNGSAWGKLPAGAALASEGFDDRRFCSSQLSVDLVFGCSGLELFELKLHLLDQVARALRRLSVQGTAHLLVLQFEMGVARDQIGVDRPDPGDLGPASLARIVVRARASRSS